MINHKESDIMQITVSVDDATYAKLQRLADERGITVEDYLARFAASVDEGVYLNGDEFLAMLEQAHQEALANEQAAQGDKP
jgi:hypothetical protein